MTPEQTALHDELAHRLTDMCVVAADYKRPDAQALLAQMRALRDVSVDATLTRAGIASSPTAAQRAEREGRKIPPKQVVTRGKYMDHLIEKDVMRHNPQRASNRAKVLNEASIIGIGLVVCAGPCHERVPAAEVDAQGRCRRCQG